jgi:hypothetical protein
VDGHLAACCAGRGVDDRSCDRPSPEHS